MQKEIGCSGNTGQETPSNHTEKITDPPNGLSSYFKALETELQAHPEIIEIASRLEATKADNDGSFHELTALTRLQRTLTALIAEAGVKKIEAKLRLHAISQDLSIGWIWPILI